MPEDEFISVSCTVFSSSLREKARNLAEKLGLPLCLAKQCTTLYQLVYTDRGLQLVQTAPATSGSSSRPISVDFESGAAAYRHHTNTTIKQPLAKAVGIKPGVRPRIVDCTAGLGMDAFVFACLGCQVTLCERSPILHALLADGLARAACSDRLADEIVPRMHLIHADAREYLTQRSEPVETIYLDPMYPHRRKSALNKLELRVIRDLVGDDEDGPELLDIARATASKRVVVKRPKGAPHLDEVPPSLTIAMKSSRFDIYLCG